MILSFFYLCLGFFPSAESVTPQPEVIVSADAAADSDRPEPTRDQPVEAEVAPETAPIASIEPHKSEPILATVVVQDPPAFKEHIFKVGDSLSTVLPLFGLSDLEIHEITEAAKEIYNFRKILPGQTIKIAFDTLSNRVGGLLYEIDATRRLKIERTNDRFIAVEENVPLERELESHQGIITDNFYDSARRAGISARIIMNLADIFEWDLDFAAEIRKGDEFRVLYETFKKDGQLIRSGQILAAEITNRGRAIRAYYFAPEGKKGGYYDEKGRILRKMFLKSPLRYRYISSGYTRRRLHPILKVNRPHLGIDYAARHGTPVRAASSGVIEFAGWKGGNGKTVIIRHPNGYKTLYGHLSSFGRGVRKGKRVAQSDMIGRVGSTGLSTGPHLHYTLYKNGKAINPNRAGRVRSQPLKKRWLRPFKETVKELNKRLYPESESIPKKDST